MIRFKNPQTARRWWRTRSRAGWCSITIELDDLIIVRSDGTPTYNFCVVVDDMDMRITHVIRGDDHLNNTPRQMNILKALGVTPPEYAHLPMILGPDGTKLSKRHGAVSVMQYREDGFLPEAVINYLVRLGWSHGDQEIFSREEMVAALRHQGREQVRFRHQPAETPVDQPALHQDRRPDRLAAELGWHLARIGVHRPEAPLEALVKAQQERAKTLKEMAEGSRFLFEEVGEYDPQAAAKNLTAGGPAGATRPFGEARGAA